MISETTPFIPGPFSIDTWFPVGVMALLMVLGIVMLAVEMRRAGTSEAPSKLAQAIAEKDPEANGKTSFSRLAAALGAFVLTAYFAGLSFWSLFALEDTDGTQIQERIAGLWPLIMIGVALFAPYAFNQLSRLGNAPHS